MSDEQLTYRIAISHLPGIGDINARKLINYLGDERLVFTESYRSLIKIPGIGSRLAELITSNRSLDRARKEVDFIRKNNISTTWYSDPDYPKRLKECPDSPVLVYYSGDLRSDSSRVLSIVGTRNATRKGKELCNLIIDSLAALIPDLVIVSGLAYGIDITAHKAALRNNIPTLGVMAHGFATLYPSVHVSVAKKMLESGALLTDFLSDEPPDRNNFLKRNRIIAGISDATLVVESDIKGGAMVTADIASSYSRDIFAVPGTPGDKFSSGCNLLIKSNRASLAEKGEDIVYYMGWERKKKTFFNPTLFIPSTPLEKDIIDLLVEKDSLSVDNISEILGVAVHTLSSALLSLQFGGQIKALPGNVYRLAING